MVPQAHKKVGPSCDVLCGGQIGLDQRDGAEKNKEQGVTVRMGSTSRSVPFLPESHSPIEA